MPEVQARSSGLIGPNAILQLMPVLVARLGASRADKLLQIAAISSLPDGTAMIPQEDAAYLHQTIRAHEPDRADQILQEAGEHTADYILAHRIPMIAQMILKALPAPLAARLLSRAITQHAWTFAGSGHFRAVTPWHFEISGNPLIAGERSDHPLCRWHAAVFTRLYSTLVSPKITCVEEACGATHGTGCCCFVLRRQQVAAQSSIDKLACPVLFN